MIRRGNLPSGAWATPYRGGWLAAGIGLLLLFPLSSPDAFFLDVFTTGFLLAAFAASWDVVGGVSGQITLGHALPFGVAAYACALFTSFAGWPLPVAVAAAVLLAAAVGAGIGTLSAPLAGPFVAVLTLALGEIAHEVAVGNTFFSGPGMYAWGGEGGIPVALPWRDAPPFSSYYAALAFLCLASFGMLRFTRSSTGLILRAVAGSPITALASGVPIARFKRLAFAVGSAFAGAAGAGFVLQVGRATPTDLSLELSFQAATFAAVGARDDCGSRRRGARPPCPLPGALPAPFGAGPALRADPAGHPAVLPRGSRRDRTGPGLAARRGGRGGAPAPPRPEPVRGGHTVNTLLSAERITKAFGAAPILSGITLSVAPGEPVGLFGPNGSGKTTLVNILSGLLLPDGGTIRFDGKEITRLPLDARYRLGIARTFQIPHPYPALSVHEAVRVALAANGGKRKEGDGTREDEEGPTEDLLARTGLFNQRLSVLPLSQGCLRRLEFARGLASGRSC